MKNIYYILLCLLPINFIAQDIHFTQTVFTPQIINPATVGLFDGWERITLSHRQQWIGINNPYITSQFSFDMNLLKKDDGPKKSYLGLGLAFYNDIAGDSKFGINQINLSVASIIPIAEKHTISTAIQIGGVQRSGNLDALTWGNQFDQSSNSFNTEIDPHESNGMSSFFHEDFGAGVFYKYHGSKSTIKRNEISDMYVGVSYLHLTKPNLKFRNGTSDRLYSKIVFHGGSQVDIPNTDLACAGSFVFFKQGPHQQILADLMLKARIHEGTKFTGIYNESYIGFGVIYRYTDALAPQLLLEIGSYKIGLLYEFTTSKLSSVAKGCFEISFQWANMKNALFKSRRKGDY